MRIKIDELDIVQNKTLKHVSTSYQVWATQDFSNVSGEIFSEPKDTQNLYEKYIPYTLKDNERVYLRVKLHFADGTESDWSRTITIDGDMKGFKFSGNIVATPILTSNSISTKSLVGGFKILTSDYKLYSGIGNHEHTNWEILDTYGRTVWERKEDRNNLTAITLPDNLLEHNTAYVIRAQHVNTYNTPSNYGVLNIVTGGGKKEEKTKIIVGPRGESGPPGTGFTKATIDNKGHLILTLERRVNG